MRAIDSAFVLSQKLHKRLNVVWLENTPQLRCPFKELFQPISQVNVISPRVVSLYLNPQDIDSSNSVKKSLLALTTRVFQTVNFQKVIGQNEAIELIQTGHLETLANYKSLMILTDRSFYPTNTYALFKPIPPLADAIEARTRAFGKSTIGLHIRRGDHRKAIEHSPLSLFIDAIRREIKHNADATFYLASDSLTIKQTLVEQFGDRILTRVTPTSRNSEQGMQDAVIDLYSLSRTSKIYGSYWSSYSRVAADIANLKLVILTTRTT